MVTIKCPKCRSKVEIEDRKNENEDKTAVFCTNEGCFFNKHPLIGLDRKEQEVFVSESLI